MAMIIRVIGTEHLILVEIRPMITVVRFCANANQEINNKNEVRKNIF